MEEFGTALRKIRFGAIDPELRDEVREVAAQLGYESAIRAESDLHFLLKLYEAEKAKEKGRKDALKKAEELILRLSSLHHEAYVKEMERKRSQKKEKPFRWGDAAGMPISKKALDLFASIGITNERTMAHVLDFLGERKLEDRVDLILSSALPESVVKGLFGHRPELLLKAEDSDFIAEIETMEAKKGIVDNRYAQLGMAEPVYIVYPEILAESYHEVARIMQLEPAERAEPAPADEEKKRKLRVNPIHPDDFIKVLRGLGFELKSSGPHRVLSHPDGRVCVVQSAHGSNRQFGAGLIRMKLRDSDIPVEDFENKRKEIGL